MAALIVATPLRVLSPMRLSGIWLITISALMLQNWGNRHLMKCLVGVKIIPALSQKSEGRASC
ncbi:hypothetical protein DSCO28_34630 [Desulfosarcina ovata subsp. sediminis]|uniref:Uncharacterized protein n=1 Tax=Desulfosarcina ovata subsp. sediminis TaxID=885957 RepID=A0A5K7ZPZ3_9BACT|nr:hypothetical protein DSCO28_34630 [Desulfosarcina ovata subsp. sediminis]